MNWKNDHHFSHVQATCPLSWALTNKFEKNFSCNLGNMWMHLMLEEYLNVQHVSNDLFLYLAISTSSSLERPWLAPVAGNFLSGSCLTYQLFSFFCLGQLICWKVQSSHQRSGCSWFLVKSPHTNKSCKMLFNNS